MSNDKDKGKKSLKKKSISSSSVLVQLYNDRKLATKVDNMLDEGQTYDYIVSYCESKGLSISKASLSNYKKKREESIESGIPLIQLLDKRAKDNVTYIKDKEVNLTVHTGKGEINAPSISKSEKVYNDIEALDEIIGKGMKGLKQFDVVDTPLMLKAIEIKAKLTNNQLSGLSMTGLKEMQMRVNAREAAMMEIIMQFVPEDKHDQLFEAMDKAEEEFYENLDINEEDRKLTKAMRDANIEI